MFEPEGQRDSLLSAVNQICTLSPSISVVVCCLNSAQEYSWSRKTEWMNLFSFYGFVLSLKFVPLSLSLSSSPPHFLSPSPLPSPLPFSLYLFNKVSSQSLLRGDPSHSSISSENYSYFFRSLISFSSLLLPLLNLLTTRAKCIPVKCY